MAYFFVEVLKKDKLSVSITKEHPGDSAFQDVLWYYSFLKVQGFIILKAEEGAKVFDSCMTLRNLHIILFKK